MKKIIFIVLCIVMFLSMVSCSGESAYDIAVRHGFEGTEEEWLDSLKGEPGKSNTTQIIIGKNGHWYIDGVDTGIVAGEKDISGESFQVNVPGDMTLLQYIYYYIEYLDCPTISNYSSNVTGNIKARSDSDIVNVTEIIAVYKRDSKNSRYKIEDTWYSLDDLISRKIYVGTFSDDYEYFYTDGIGKKYNSYDHLIITGYYK